jgi:hypothetical protein
MADRIEWYRGYEIALYHRDRPDVRAMINATVGLPTIHGGPSASSIALALEKARERIDQALANVADPN